MSAVFEGSKSGRGWAPLQGEYQQTRALAQWLRDVIDRSGLNLRALDDVLPWGRDKLSRNLNGASRPEWPVVRAIVEACCRDEPFKRQARLAEARKRWESADPATATPLSAAASASARQDSLAARERDLYEQLVQAVDRCATLERALGESTTMVVTLRAMVSSLRGQIQTLAQERDQLRSAADAELRVAEVLEALAATHRQRERAEDALQRARGERDEAERLRVIAEEQAARWRTELELLRSADVSSSALPEVVLHLPAPGSSIAVINDIDNALHSVDAFLARRASELVQLADDLDAPAEQDPRVIVGDTIDPLASPQADNASASADMPDNPDSTALAPWTLGQLSLERARLLIQQGDLRTAQQLLDDALDHGFGDAAVLLAELAEMTGHPSQAAHQLARGAALGSALATSSLLSRYGQDRFVSLVENARSQQPAGNSPPLPASMLLEGQLDELMRLPQTARMLSTTGIAGGSGIVELLARLDELADAIAPTREQAMKLLDLRDRQVTTNQWRRFTGTPHYALIADTKLQINGWIAPCNEPDTPTRRHRAHILTDDGRIWRLNLHDGDWHVRNTPNQPNWRTRPVPENPPSSTS